MKSAFCLSAALVAAGLVGATPFAQDGVVRDLVAAAPALVVRKAENDERGLSAEAIDSVNVCILDVYQSGNSSGTPVTINGNFDFTSFCSSFLPKATSGPVYTTIYSARTVTTTAVAKTSSVTMTALTTTTVSISAVQSTSTAQVIEYCPLSNVGAVCNITAWAGPTPAIHAGTEDLLTCHQLCLSTATCKSFQVSAVTGTGIIPQCNLYTVSAGGTTNGTANFNVGAAAPFILYDRDCPDALPAGCNQVVPVRTTTVAPVTSTVVSSSLQAIITSFVTITYSPPSSPVTVGQVAARAPEEQGLEVRQVSLGAPEIIALIGSVTLSEICTCIIGPQTGVAVQTTSTLYVASSVYATTTPTVVKTVTALGTVTTTVSGTAGGIIYSSIA